tara:strand:- start:1113 stop:1511 length:399 start_codon:yes stop_codon:yes gene_type:complete
MNKESIQSIINKSYPKIEKYYGHSKYQNCTPYIELHHNIYIRITGDEYDQDILSETECNPDAEYDRFDNTIIIYWPKMVNKETIIKSLIHEYQHYLQSPSWMKRYYNMGYDYDNHPYEIQARESENNWKTFA